MDTNKIGITLFVRFTTLCSERITNIIHVQLLCDEFQHEVIQIDFAEETPRGGLKTHFSRTLQNMQFICIQIM